jgi:hypothetical protein
METKLNKVKQTFNKIKDIRIAVVNIFATLEIKIGKLKLLANDFIKNNHETLFVFGLDSFMFQSKMIDYEYNDMQKYFSALNNRMYCEYYKLYKIVLEYIEQNSGISQNKTFEMIKANSKFPIYKDLEPYKQYNFDTIEEVHKTIISLLNIINDYIVLKDTELENYKMKQYSGFNINNFVNTFDYNIIMVKQKLLLFMAYLEFFHNIHTKHFKRFSKKMKLMDDHINDDIQFDDSPRRKLSRDFDDTSSESSSSAGVTVDDSMAAHINNVEHEKHHRAAPRKSMLKKSVDNVINGLKAFGQKTKNKPDADLTNNIKSENEIKNSSIDSVNLIISETNSEFDGNELNEQNIALISQEESKTISDGLNNDPNFVSKMFDQLTKTFDDEDKKSVKSTSSRGSRKGVKKEKEKEQQIKSETIEENVIEKNDIEKNDIEKNVIKEPLVIKSIESEHNKSEETEENEENDNELAESNLGNNSVANSNKKKKKGKKK